MAKGTASRDRHRGPRIPAPLIADLARPEGTCDARGFRDGTEESEHGVPRLSLLKEYYGAEDEITTSIREDEMKSPVLPLLLLTYVMLAIPLLFTPRSKWSTTNFRFRAILLAFGLSCLAFLWIAR